MGIEHKVYCSLSNEQKTELSGFIETHDDYARTVNIEGRNIFEFRKDKMSRGLPDYSMSIEEDGLYICRYTGSDAWEGIHCIRQYLIDKKLPFLLEEL